MNHFIMSPLAWTLSATAAAAVAALLAVWMLLRRGLRRIAEWMKQVSAGESLPETQFPRWGPLAVLAREAESLAKSLLDARDIARQEARLRELGDSLWTAERLREHVRVKLRGRSLIVVAHREPYRHTRKNGSVEVVMPASGLVTGLEPLLRACGGTWIAHGDGSADRETADAQGRLRVPPDRPQYALKRVWLTAEEEKGFYYGFSNEGLWPLCHIAHHRPLFRAEDWSFYQAVNRKFAKAALEEIENVREPCLLIQDYHFTLLPRLIKERRPDARVGLFWHIPWPNPEAFGICPWQKELLDGMLGADLIGFHTQYNCNNFLETIDRFLESRIDREHFAIKRAGRRTVVKPFPISVDFSEPSIIAALKRPAERKELLKRAGIEAEFVAVGVDRLDYTKGILERFRAVERFLDKYPAYRGGFVLVQIGAPSRAEIPSYQEFVREVEAEATRINARFMGQGQPPIVLFKKHHSHAEIEPYYRAADLCLVTSLHDGMNLVAKEFAASRDDNRGVLVLSRFTGAARELRDALIVNPYDTDELSEAIRQALEMPPEEQGTRMRRLRRQIRDNNIYRWAGDLISELAAIRPSQDFKVLSETASTLR